jgi:hypothetical protein
MIDEIVSIIGEYTPVVVDGVVCPNFAQICAYVLICIGVYSLFRLIGKAVFRK